jgi:N-acetylglucosaminyl-diphospho-decaprenol L-rhamnosyltransferase
MGYFLLLRRAENHIVTLSIIIVNYNVKYFLEQCLCSVIKAMQKIEGEVLIVDNHSTDGSLDYLQKRFASVRYLINEKNEGFAKANNLALLEAKGKYVLFLNPDTIVAEDSLEKCLLFLEDRPEGGALGVRMIDGRGRYLKESKRGFPSPWVAFCKMSGMSALFPNSRFFAQYYLGFLNENADQVIDAISGAFFLVKKQALEKSGGFDEQFFMYGEDIDLSRRIQQSGFLNYYLSGTTIIHFKGESTKKDFRYVQQFYKAMSQYTKKYGVGNSSAILTGMIQVAIKIRTGIALIGNRLSSKNPGNKSNPDFFLLGDRDCAESLRKWSSFQKLSIVNTEYEAQEIILCEGRGFSFKAIIGIFQRSVPKRKYRIHASSSQSIVGSHSKNAGGMSIPLY